MLLLILYVLKIYIWDYFLFDMYYILIHLKTKILPILEIKCLF
jgi:hypothetical protein